MPTEPQQRLRLAGTRRAFPVLNERLCARGRRRRPHGRPRRARIVRHRAERIVWREWLAAREEARTPPEPDLALFTVPDENPGDVLEPEFPIAAIGSGGNYALSAARALYEYEDDAEKIARKAMTIAAEVCVYTNSNFVLETLDV